MRVRANLQAIQINPAQRKVLDAYVEEAIKEAGRIWVRAAVEKIPVWSGASRATLQALADAVGEHIDIDVKGTAPDRIGLGRLYSSGGLEQHGLGSWSFTYETSLRYMIANETKQVAPRTEGLRGSLIEPTPWEFRKAGNDAVKEFFKTIEVPLLKLVSKRV